MYTVLNIFQECSLTRLLVIGRVEMQLPCWPLSHVVVSLISCFSATSGVYLVPEPQPACLWQNFRMLESCWVCGMPRYFCLWSNWAHSWVRGIEVLTLAPDLIIDFFKFSYAEAGDFSLGLVEDSHGVLSKCIPQRKEDERHQVTFTRLCNLYRTVNFRLGQQPGSRIWCSGPHKALGEKLDL